MLDIGVVSHSARYFDLPDWRHGRIHKAASYCVGIDILEPLVKELNERGLRKLLSQFSKCMQSQFNILARRHTDRQQQDRRGIQ